MTVLPIRLGKEALRGQELHPALRTLYPPLMIDPHAMLAVAIDEARKGLAEGGIPIGAAIFRQDGTLVGSGHNRRVQQNDPSAHGETDAFRNAGRQRYGLRLGCVCRRSTVQWKCN